MPKDLALKLMETVHTLRRDLAEATEHASELPAYLDPLLREARETIEKLERRRTELRTPRHAPIPSEKLAAVGVQKREMLIETLALLGRAAAPTTVSRTAALLYGAEISPSQFASIRKGDERSYLRGRRLRIILVPALSASDLTVRAGTITLSDWPLEHRIIGHFSERVDALHVILRLLDLHEQQPQRNWFSILRPLAQSFRIQGKAPEDAGIIRDAVHQELAVIEAKDLEERQKATARAAKMPENRRLFGSLASIADAGEMV